MTDTAKCEPPEALRGVDGWHWVQLPFVAVPTPIAWMCNPDNQEREWRMPSAPAFVSGESKTARTWRYLSPALTPTEAAALRAERDAAVAERDELQATFDLQWKADMRAVAMWHKAHPGNDLVWPDRANMVVWLLERDERRNADAQAFKDQASEVCQRADAELTTLRAEVEKLREALKPFADAAPKFRDCGDAIEVADIAHDATFTVGNLRRAATLASAVEVGE